MKRRTRETSSEPPPDLAVFDRHRWQMFALERRSEWGPGEDVSRAAVRYWEAALAEAGVGELLIDEGQRPDFTYDLRTHVAINELHRRLSGYDFEGAERYVRPWVGRDESERARQAGAGEDDEGSEG